ncbi:hypothetical protein QQ045_033432 [Rhodiola kirilowii]
MEEKSSEDHDERGGKSMFSGEAGLSRPTAIGNCDDDEEEEFDEDDSGAESDDIDLLELGEVGVEFCLVGDQTCSIPLELYDLLDLSDVLSLDVWNECLSEEDRFELAKYLPDMDEVTFMWTLKDLLSGDDFHFGNPVHRLFEMMKGGLCEPRVALYRQGLNMLQKCKHYHQLRKYQNNMVSSFYQIRDIWITCRGYSIEEKLHKLNLVRSQKTLMYEKTNDIGLDGASLGRDDPDGDIWSQTLMETKVRQKKGSHFDYQENFGHLSGKQKCKALLNLAEPITLAKQPACYPPYVQYGSSSAIPKRNKKARYEMNPFLGEKKEAEEVIYNAAMQRNTDAVIRYVSEVHKSGKRHGCLRGDELSSLNFKGIPLMNGDTHQVNQLSDITVLTTKPSNGGASYDFGKKMSYFGNIHAYTGRSKIGGNCKNQVPGSAALLGSQGGISDPSEHLQRRKYQPEASMRNQLAQDKWDTCRKTPQMKRNSLDLDMMSHINDEAPAPLANYRAEFSAEYMGGNCVQNGAPDITALRGKSISQSDETESDSSKHVEEESNPLWNREFPYLGTGSMSGDFGFENVNYLTKKNFMKGDLGENAHLDMQIVETCSKKVKRNSDVVKANHLKDISLRVTEDEIISDKGASNNKDSKRKKFVLGKTRNLLGGLGERSIALEEYPLDVGPKTANECDPSLNLSNQLSECGASGHDLLEADELVGDLGAQEASAKKRRSKEITGYERAKSYQGCSQLEKKQKRKGKGICMGPQDKYDHLHSDPQRTPVPENVEETETGSHVLETSDPQCTEMELIDAELEAKAQRTRFTLITPTVHSGLPFSVIHLLSAVRVVMTTPQPEDTLVVSQPIEEGMQQAVENAENHENANNFVPQVHGRVPTLTIQEIVNRVRSNPGDPCILETDEPLQDLVRGVLKVFSSRKGTLGAKDWKPLAAYRKSTKSWYWIGSVLQSSSSDQETTEEVTSPDAWGIPRKILVKLVDSFANWLVSSQEVLQQLGTLPAPPASLYQLKLEEKDRFKDQRAQKSACTFEPSSAEVRDYFRLEEALRYSIPDRAFAYTAADGSKSMVAPLRRCGGGGGGKPTSKPRDHFLLKPDRPPHVTILCLVRDAASRLPGCVGTRSDICTLMRDSQYIVEDFPDSQMNQIVSGALDRLHYEHDPCVRYENDRKIWVYLHRERTEEDFEDDGTSSTRRWKRPPKKDPDQVTSSAALDQDNAEEETVGGSEKCDYNVEPPPACVDEEEDIIVDIM